MAEEELCCRFPDSTAESGTSIKEKGLGAVFYPQAFSFQVVSIPSDPHVSF